MKNATPADGGTGCLLIGTNQIIFQHTCCPPPKFNTPRRMNPIPNRNNDIKVIASNFMVLYFIRHRAMPSGMCKICTYHFRINFTLFYGIFDMFCNDSSIFSEQFRHLLLRKPNSITVHRDRQRHLSVTRLKQNHFFCHRRLLLFQLVRIPYLLPFTFCNVCIFAHSSCPFARAQSDSLRAFMRWQLSQLTGNTGTSTGNELRKSWRPSAR